MYLSKKFICASNEFSTFENHIPAPVFRKKVLWNNQYENIKLSICGLGYYKLYINGQDVTRGFLSSYTANPDNVLCYDVYDIKTYLQRGENVFAVMLGNGFLNQPSGFIWGYDKADFRSAPKFAMAVIGDDELLLETNESFLVGNSPILFDDLRAGEHFDGNSPNLYFYSQTFDDSTWGHAQTAVCPKGVARINNAPPIRAFEEVPAKSVVRCKNGYVYDFGINSAGIFRLSIDGKKGQVLRMTLGEDFTKGELKTANISFPNRTVDGYNQNCVYYLRDGKQTYEPTFTYYGYRFIYIEGIEESQAQKSLLTMIRMSSDLKQRSSFSCSDERINKLYRNCLNSNRSNLFHIPTDCPHREKNGWTGDVRVSAEQFALHFEGRDLFNEWLFHIDKSKNENGIIPCIVPNFGKFGLFPSPAWTGVVIELPYQLYRYSGDKNCILQNFNAIKEYIYSLKATRRENGMLARGFGDREEFFTEESSEHTTSEEVTGHLVGIDLCLKASALASIINQNQFAKECEDFANEMKDLFTDLYVENGLLKVRTQTAYALALQVDLFGVNGKNRALDELKALIRENGNKAKVGIIGFGVLYDVLTKNGEQQLAYELALSEEYPGFLYTIKMGVTSMWESYSLLQEGVEEYIRVDEKKKPSFNHHWYGHISAWIFKNIGGIYVDYNSKIPFTVYVPKWLPLDYATSEFTNGNDYIKVQWKKENGNINVNVDSNCAYNLLS